MTEYRTANASPGSKQSTLPHPLRLKVIGTARHGQTVDIFSARLTIGAGPQCTLRLRAAGVGPLQCLIVREPTGPVARSLAMDTLLNGQKFREELLHTGDLLQVGSIQLEVCDDGRTAVTKSETPVRSRHARRLLEKPDLSSWTDKKSERPLEVLSRIERLEERFNQLRDTELTTNAPSIKDAAEKTKAIEPPVPALLAPLSATKQELQQKSAELQRLKVEFDRANESYNQARSELTRLQSERDTLQNRCEELANSQLSVEDKLRKLQVEVLRQACECQQLFDSQRKDFESHCSTATKDTKQVRESLDQLTAQQTEAIQTLTQIGQNLATEYEHRRELEQKLEQQSQRVADVEAQCRALQASVELRLARPSNPIATIGNKLETQAESNSHVEAKQAPTSDAGADYRRRQQRDFLAQQVAAVEANPLARADDRAPQATAIPTACVLPAQQNRSAEGSLSFAQSTPEQTPDRSFNDPIPRYFTDVVCEAEPVSDEPTPSESDSNSDVFARLSQAGIWKPSEQPAEGEDGSTATDVLAAYSDDYPNGSSSSLDSLEKVYEPTVIKSAQNVRSETVEEEVNETEARKPSDSTHASSNGDDIEAYMQRLLQRVRGDSAFTPVSTTTFEPVSERSPQTEVEVEIAEPIQATVLTESEYQPRSQAPEAGVNLAAMREIGNDNRRKDILKHAQRSWTEKARTKLIGSVGGLAVAFASFFYLDTNPEYAAAGLLTGFGVAGFWLWQALRCRKQFVASLRLESEQK